MKPFLAVLGIVVVVVLLLVGAWISAYGSLNTS